MDDHTAPVEVDDVLAFVEEVDIADVPDAAEALFAEEEVPLPDFDVPGEQTVVIGSQIAGFASTVPAELRSQIANAFLLAQLAADKKITGGAGSSRLWYHAYVETLGKIGFVLEEAEASMRDVDGTSSDVHNAIIGVLTTILSPAAAAASSVIAVLKGLANMNKDAPWIVIFQKRSQRAKANQFQVSQIEGQDGSATILLVGFELDASNQVTQVLFFRFGTTDAKLFQFTRRMSLNADLFAAAAPKIAQKLQAHTLENIVDIEI